MPLNQYQVVGRKAPTDTDPTPQIFRMRIFAKTGVAAQSRFWYFLHQYKKMKRSTGQILSVNEIREPNTNIVRNYGITIRYNSRSGTHNMYKEFRATDVCKAVSQMYQDMAGRHRARFSTIHIVDAAIVPAGVKASKRYNPLTDGDAPAAVQRPIVKQFLNSKIKFPLAHRIARPAEKKFRHTFAARRPTTYFS
mmetsp:Transcript_27269/g.31961  ORF Transcript_27269/g.31961 Transcript_27269/m.31961 type:complete len:194 (+) Transcript_27269:20-601(+)